MGRRVYSEETKAAVMAALLTGQSVSVIAEEYNIPADTIYCWKSRQKNGENLVTLASSKKELIGDLLMGYLEDELRAARARTKVFGDPEWIRRQGASEVAVLHGVSIDKAIRLLEAFAGDDEAA